MQKVAAYLLERRDALTSDAESEAEAERIRGAVLAWLGTKGAEPTIEQGDFVPVRGHAGRFLIERASDAGRSWWMLTLTETSPEGVAFRTAVSVTAAGPVSVYLTLEAGLDHSRVGSHAVDARCPQLVRDLLRLGGRWFHGKSQLMDLQQVRGYHAGVALAEEIAFAERTVPVVVVSEDKGGLLAAQDLDRRIAFDLAGLANTCRVDGDASWALSDALGVRLTCYGGSVRLYWPGWSRRAATGAHPFWTSAQLAGPMQGPKSPRELLRRTLRSRVFSSAAFGVVRPKAVDAIREASQRATFEEKLRQAVSKADLSAIAEDYAKANDKLVAEKRAFEEKIKDLETQVANLETRLRHAEQVGAAQGAATPPADELAPAAEEAEEDRTPKRGEIRFYKKMHDAGPHDVMREVADCGHNNWQGAFKADKAKKGIERRAGSSAWQSVQHCAKCTGGGMWKVRW